MNLTSYDTALKAKLKSVFDNVINASEDKALEYSEDGKAEVHLPLISYWRLSNPLNDNYNNNTPIRRSRVIGRLNDSECLAYQEITLLLTYQVDIWSDRRYETDEILKELLLFFKSEPYIEVVEDNAQDPFNIMLRVVDINTDIDLTSFSDKGYLYRQSIILEIDDAKLTSPQAKKVAKTIPIRLVALEDGEDL